MHKGKSFNQVQGVRGNRYSGSKLTNWADFDPISSAIDQAWEQHYKHFKDNEDEIYFCRQPTHQRFIMPLTIEGIKEKFSIIPKQFLKGLKAVFLLSGSNKQEKIFFSRLFCYGTYWNSSIFIHPYPKSNLHLHWKKPPKPSVLNDYRRVGALIEKTDKEGIDLKWEDESLRAFYYRDVLIHEIGHHIDNNIASKKNKKVESFAEWFATKYGFKFKYYQD
jgi:hypothetical protein